MRKLLIGSPSGGAGKTTATLNLAAAGGLSGSRTLLVAADPDSDLTEALRLKAHGDQTSLNELGVADYGRLYRNALPNVDILCPYDTEHAGPEDLTAVVTKLGHAYFDKYVWCLLDAPPLAERQHAESLQIADELIYALRATARTAQDLAAFTALAREVEQTNTKLMVRGVLLILSDAAEDEAAEGLLRQELGRRALPVSIPFDPAVQRSAEAARPVVLLDPEAPASQAFRELAEVLGVARPSSAIITAAPKSQPTAAAVAVAKAASVKVPPAPPRLETLSDPGREPPRTTPRKTFSPSVSGDFKMDNEALDRMLGMEQRAEPDGGKRPPGPRRNEARSFLDIEYDALPTGLDQPPGRVPQLEEHIAAHRPASRSAIPVPRAPTASAPPSRPPGTPGSSPQIRVRPATPATAETPDSSGNLGVVIWWVVGVFLMVFMGLGISYLATWASATGNMAVFLAGLLGVGVTVGILVVGALAGRRN
jgi:cellulose biosynthesis protein BcsQ